MWLIVLMLLLMVPMVAASVVYLLVALWRCLDALLQGTIGAVRITWRAGVGLWRVMRWMLRTGRRIALQLRDWHDVGSTWAGQFLQSCWFAWSNTARRRYIAGQLRRLRRARHPE